MVGVGGNLRILGGAIISSPLSVFINSASINIKAVGVAVFIFGRYLPTKAVRAGYASSSINIRPRNIGEAVIVEIAAGGRIIDIYMYANC